MKKASNILHRQNMRKIHDIYIVAKSKIFTIFEIRSEVGPKFNITHIYAFLFRSFFHINFRKFYEEIIIWTCKLYLKKFQMKSLFLLLFDLESLGFLSKQYIYIFPLYAELVEFTIDVTKKQVIVKGNANCQMPKQEWRK